MSDWSVFPCYVFHQNRANSRSHYLVATALTFLLTLYDLTGNSEHSYSTFCITFCTCWKSLNHAPSAFITSSCQTQIKVLSLG